MDEPFSRPFAALDFAEEAWGGDLSFVPRGDLEKAAGRLRSLASRVESAIREPREVFYLGGRGPWATEGDALRFRSSLGIKGLVLRVTKKTVAMNPAIAVQTFHGKTTRIGDALKAAEGNRP